MSHSLVMLKSERICSGVLPLIIFLTGVSALSPKGHRRAYATVLHPTSLIDGFSKYGEPITMRLRGRTIGV